MKSYLQHLENNEAILLMYLGNELPDQDRVEVEEMLASDARLRAELENLRLTQQLAWDALGSLDAMTRPPMSPIAAQNRRHIGGVGAMLMWPSLVRNAPVGAPVGWLLPTCCGTSPFIV